MGRAGNCSVLLGAGGYVGVGDGFQGLAVASGADGVVEVFRGFGDGTFAAPFVRNPTPGSPSPCGKSPLLSAPSIPKVMDSSIPLTAVV